MPQKPMKSAQELLDMYYLEMRCNLLEVAATLDRIEAAGGTDDPRLQRLLEAATIGLDDKPDRARRFLEALSEE
ncbi:MAG: hypothetical protein ACOCQP_03380 [Lentisphaeria bacterium]